MDLVVGNYAGVNELFLNGVDGRGIGVFTAHLSTPFTAAPERDYIIYRLAFADIDGDQVRACSP